MIINWTNGNATHYLGLSCVWNWAADYLGQAIIAASYYQGLYLDTDRRTFTRSSARHEFEKDTERRVFIP